MTEDDIKKYEQDRKIEQLRIPSQFKFRVNKIPTKKEEERSKKAEAKALAAGKDFSNTSMTNSTADSWVLNLPPISLCLITHT